MRPCFVFIRYMRNNSINRLLKIMARMRAPGGCPWDRKQTLGTLKQYLVEECYEVMDAIDSGDPDKHAEELGDLLLQVVFQAQIRREKGQFTFDDVVAKICEKLIRRHPHVFGGRRAGGRARVISQKEVLRNWEQIKAGEKQAKHGRTGPVSLLGGLPRHLPALHKAHQFQQRLARVGFDWKDVDGVVSKIEEELAEVKQALAQGDARHVRTEVGDLLFAVVNLCRFRKMHAEEVLQDSIAKFGKRFRAVESRARADGKALTRCSLAELDRYWEAVKKQERKRSSRPGKS